MEFRKMVTMTLYVRQQKRPRCKEQTFGLWEKARVGWLERIALKHVYYHMWIGRQSRFHDETGCSRLVHRDDPEGWDGEGGRGVGGGGSGWGTHVHPWLIPVNVWQKPLQYCKVISLQLNKLKNRLTGIPGVLQSQTWLGDWTISKWQEHSHSRKFR